MESVCCVTVDSCSTVADVSAAFPSSCLDSAGEDDIMVASESDFEWTAAERVELAFFFSGFRNWGIR